MKCHFRLYHWYLLAVRGFFWAKFLMINLEFCWLHSPSECIICSACPLFRTESFRGFSPWTGTWQTPVSHPPLHTSYTFLSICLSSSPRCIQLFLEVWSIWLKNESNVCLEKKKKSLPVFTEVLWVGTFQRIKALPFTSVRSAQLAHPAHCLQRHYYSGLLRHDPRHSSHWNEGEWFP